MLSIVVHNRKGGVGKTTITGNLAYILSKSGKTLAIDSDPQGNLSRWLCKNEIHNDLGDILFGEIEARKALQNVRENLDICPVESRNSSYQKFLETQLPSEPFVFLDLKDEIYKLSYDFVIVDTPPSGGLVSDCILSFSDEVVIVLHGDRFSFEGLEILLDSLQDLKRKRRVSFSYNTIVLNKVNKSIASHNVYQRELEKLHRNICIVPQYQQFANCILQGSILTEEQKIPGLEELASRFLKNKGL